jgi:short-subunit dehydrogenase
MKILVTGCSSGLGKELIKIKKYEMFAHYRRLDNPSVNHLVGDINDKNFSDVFQNFLSSHSINVLINNAAIYRKQSILDMAKKDIELLIDTNLFSPILLSQIAISHFKQIGGGLIVNINSLAGKNGSPGESIYSATKFGLRGFSNSIRYEVREFGVNILDVYLGGMQTRMTDGRSDQDTLIDPREAAETLLKVIEDYESLNLTEMEIRKK